MGGSSKSNSTNTSIQADNRSFADNGALAVSALEDAFVTVSPVTAEGSGVALMAGDGAVIHLDQVPDEVLAAVQDVLRDARDADLRVFDTAVSRSESEQARILQKVLMAGVAVGALYAATQIWGRR